MQHLDVTIDLINSTLRNVSQGDSTVVVDLDNTPEGAICLIFETASIAHQTLPLDQLAQLPAEHPARLVTWAGPLADVLFVALESGDSFSIQAHAFRLERREDDAIAPSAKEVSR